MKWHSSISFCATVDFYSTLTKTSHNVKLNTAKMVCIILARIRYHSLTRKYQYIKKKERKFPCRIGLWPNVSLM